MDRRVARSLLLLLPLCFAVIVHGGGGGGDGGGGDSPDPSTNDVGHLTSCKACTANADSHWCAWKVEMDVWIGEDWTSVVGGGCFPKSWECSSIKFGEIDQIVTANYAIVGGTYYSVIEVDPADAKCNNDQWPESLWRYSDHQSCLEAEATAEVGWCQLKGSTGRLSYWHSYDNGVCLPKAVKAFCNRDVDSQSGDIYFPGLNDAAVTGLTVTWDQRSDAANGDVHPRSGNVYSPGLNEAVTGLMATSTSDQRSSETAATDDCPSYGSCGACLDSGLQCSWCGGDVGGSAFGGKCIALNESCKAVQLGTLDQFFGSSDPPFSMDSYVAETKPSWCKTMEWPQELWKYPTCSECTSAEDAVAWCELARIQNDITVTGGVCLPEKAGVLCTGEVVNFALRMTSLSSSNYITASSFNTKATSCSA